MAVQLIVRDGMVVTPQGIRRGHIVVDHGKVVSIAERDGDLPEAKEVVDASGRHVLPGLVDPDVKFRDPGLTHKEDWASGSAAAVCGGICTVIDMPNPAFTVRTADQARTKLEAASGKSFCNFGFMASLSQADLGEIPGLIDAGVCGFRSLYPSSFGDVAMMDAGELLAAYRIVAETGYRISVVPDLHAIIAAAKRQPRPAGQSAYAGWQAARPHEAEVAGVAQALALASAAGVKLWLSTIASHESLPWIRFARDRLGLDLYAETKPHYCVIDGTIMDSQELGSMLTMLPPVRGLDNADTMLAALADGTLDALGTDHSPHTREEKHYDSRMAGVWQASPGWPGIETTVPLMLTAVNDGLLTIERYVAVHSEAPARAWGLWPRKGNLAHGADADITIVDLQQHGVIDENSFHSKHRLSPFHGRPFKGKAVMTIIGGEIVARDGELASDKPRGQFVRPE